MYCWPALNSCRTCSRNRLTNLLGLSVVKAVMTASLGVTSIALEMASSWCHSGVMDLTPYTQNLREDLLTAVSVGEEDSRRAAALLAGAIEPAARLAIMNALSDLAAEVTGALGDTTVELRLDGRDVRVSVARHQADDAGDRAQHDGYFRKRTDDRRSASADADAAAAGDTAGGDGQSAEEL